MFLTGRLDYVGLRDLCNGIIRTDQQWSYSSGWFQSGRPLDIPWRGPACLSMTLKGLLEGKTYRKPSIFPCDTGFSCKGSLKPIRWDISCELCSPCRTVTRLKWGQRCPSNMPFRSRSQGASQELKWSRVKNRHSLWQWLTSLVIEHCPCSFV